MDTRAAHALRDEAAPPAIRTREMGVLFGRVSVVFLMAAFNTTFWIFLVVFSGYLVGTEFTTRFLAILGLCILTISFVSLSLLMLERR